jgi:hypothetical protein
MFVGIGSVGLGIGVGTSGDEGIGRARRFWEGDTGLRRETASGAGRERWVTVGRGRLGERSLATKSGSCRGTNRGGSSSRYLFPLFSFIFERYTDIFSHVFLFIYSFNSFSHSFPFISPPSHSRITHQTKTKTLHSQS